MVPPVVFNAESGDWDTAENYEGGVPPQPYGNVALAAGATMIVPEGSEAVLGDITGVADNAVSTVVVNGGTLDVEKFVFDSEKHLAVIVNSGTLIARQLMGGGNRSNLVDFTVDLTRAEVAFDQKSEAGLTFGPPDPDGDHPGTTVTFVIGTESDTNPITMGDYYANVGEVAKFVIKSTNPALEVDDEFELISGSNIGFADVISGQIDGQPGVGYEIYKDQMGLRLRITSVAAPATP